MNNLPLVQFEYPQSESEKGVLKNRFLRVTSMTDQYVEGFELDKWEATEGKFKRFSLSRIVAGGIHLLLFTVPPTDKTDVGTGSLP